MTTTTLYKLTSKEGYTRPGHSNQLKWSVGVTHTVPGDGVEIDTDEVIHAYEHPPVAAFVGPAHATFDPQTMRLWRCEGTIVAREGQLQCGTKALTVLEEIPLPTITTEQRIKIAILCSKQVCSIPQWTRWADQWLSGEDRSQEAAWAAARPAVSVWAAGASWAASAAAISVWAAEAAAKARAAEASWSEAAAWAASGASWTTGAWAAEAARARAVEAAKAAWAAEAAAKASCAARAAAQEAAWAAARSVEGAAWAATPAGKTARAAWAREAAALEAIDLNALIESVCANP